LDETARVVPPDSYNGTCTGGIRTSQTKTQILDNLPARIHALQATAGPAPLVKWLASA